MRHGTQREQARSGRHARLTMESAALALCDLYESYILSRMKTTLNIDDALLEQAAHLTGVREKTSLVRLGLEALIARESARRLAELAGTEKRLRPIRRRRLPARP